MPNCTRLWVYSPSTAAAFMAAILTCCTLLAVLLWAALAVQTRRINRARARAAAGAHGTGHRRAARPGCLPSSSLLPAVHSTAVDASLPAPAGVLPPPPPAEAAAQRAAMAVPVIVIQPDESIEFGAKLFRTPSGSMR